MATINGYWKEIYRPVITGGEINIELRFIPAVSADNSVRIPILKIDYTANFKTTYQGADRFTAYQTVTYDPIQDNWIVIWLLEPDWSTMNFFPVGTVNFIIDQPEIISPATTKVYWRAVSNMVVQSVNYDGGISKATYVQQFIPASSIFGDPLLCRLNIAKISYGVKGDYIYSGDNGTISQNGKITALNYQAETDTWVNTFVVDYTNSGDVWNLTNITGADLPQVLTPPPVIVPPAEVVIVPPVLLPGATPKKLILYYLSLK